jgi:hypothetical protein
VVNTRSPASFQRFRGFSAWLTLGACLAGQAPRWAFRGVLRRAPPGDTLCGRVMARQTAEHGQPAQTGAELSRRRTEHPVGGADPDER